MVFRASQAASCRGAFRKWHDITVEDDVSVLMELANGATASFITSTGDTPGTNRLGSLLSAVSWSWKKDGLPF